MIFKRRQNHPEAFPPTPVSRPTAFPYYEISDLAQGTSTWLSWRKGVIGASDAPVIMGENRWQSRQFLLDEKMGVRQGFQGNDATREGHRLEGQARRLLEQRFGMDISPTVVQDGEIPFIAASLDGISGGHDRVFEIKCGEKTYFMATKGEIPRYYYGQLQHILMVTQLDKLVYAAYRPAKELIVLELARNEAYIDRMRDAEQEFADLLVAKGHSMQSKFIGRPVRR